MQPLGHDVTVADNRNAAPEIISVCAKHKTEDSKVRQNSAFTCMKVLIAKSKKEKTVA